MKVFLTGATGFIGSAIVPELIGAGHHVLGLTRSNAGAELLQNLGAQPFLGDVHDLKRICVGAAQCEAVMHLAFNHDFDRYVASCEEDRHIIEALGSVLEHSDRPLIVTSSTSVVDEKSGHPATEEDAPLSSKLAARAASEEAAAEVAAWGAKVMVVRLSQIHDATRSGKAVNSAIQAAREAGVSAYVGADGTKCLPAAHRLDTARLYRLILEKGVAGARYHAVAEEGITYLEIAETIGQHLNLPVRPITQGEAHEHFGWLSAFTGWNFRASSAKTRQQLGWQPTGPGLIADLRNLQ